MLKKSLIILSTFLFFSVLITGFPLKIDIISSEDNPFFSLENINHFVYAQDDSDKSESSSDKSESSSDKNENSSDKSESSSDKSESSSDKRESSSDKSESSSDKSESSSDKSESSSDKSESSSDKSESSSDKSESSSDKSESSSDKSESSSDKSESSSDKSESSSDNSNFDSNDEKSKENTEGNTPNFHSSPHLKDANGSDEKSKENNEMNTPDFLAGPDGDTAVDPPSGGDNPAPVGGDNPETSKDKNNIKDKINLEFDKITKIISKTKNKVIVKDDSDSEKEIIIVSDPTCPTQSETIELNGIIVPKGIRLLANFYPCIIQNGGMTMNIPESPYLNLAVIYIDNNIDNHAGTLISPSKIQSLDKNQGLFSIELDKKMRGNDPITGELTKLEKINGLALYNNGIEPIEFNEGSSVALTATFTK